jgi:hypothetical protein
MAYISNDDKMLQAILLNEQLMKFGEYTADEIGSIYQALNSNNYVINTVAQLIKRTRENASEKELWNEIFKYLKQNV